MLDSSSSERAPSRTGGTQTRLRVYMAALLAVGAIVFMIAVQSPEPGGKDLPKAPESPEAGPAAPAVDRDRIPTADDDLAHAGWQRQALDYLLPLSQGKLGIAPERVTIAELAARPFEAARGGLFRLQGTLVSLAAEAWSGKATSPGEPGEVLWTLLLEGKDGGRVLVLKHALQSDPFEGRPEDALDFSTEYLKEGDRLLVRGIYAQRRTGTFGGILVRDPIPVLVAQPPTEAFRKVLPPAAPIDHPGEADWDDVHDRFLSETKNIEEPALYEMIQWARKVGHDEILARIKSGQLPVEVWDQEQFSAWSDEVESDKADSRRPVTEGARGKLFRTRGLLAYDVREGWDAVPRSGSAWGVNEWDVLGIMSDFYGNTVFKAISAFPLSAYEGVTGEDNQHVRLYGFFLKNHTWYTQKQLRKGERAEITMPLFIVVHAEPMESRPSPYRELIWIIAGAIVVLAILFYAFLVRGESKEAARMEAYRISLKRRVRAAESKRRNSSNALSGDAGAAETEAKDDGP